MSPADDVLVTIPQGILRGKKEISCYDDVFYGFHAIPYAKPPLGELRFKAPQPAEGWASIRDATKQGAGSACNDLASGKFEKDLCDENCLFVNVYTKEVPIFGKNRPVLVWIHGGGYTIGSGNKNDFSPDYLMSHDIVFVALNYRLGALGFLSLQTAECPGNYGLKDIRLALRWIQKNISFFGGDPDNVTIFGESAGGSAVHYHLISPSCKGLFKRAISQSGAAYNPWGYARHPRECAYRLGKRLGCDAANDEELLDFLKKAPVEEIIAKSTGILSEIQGERMGENILSFSFVPTAEPESEEAFVTENPLLGGFKLDVPYIAGLNAKEMIVLIYSPKHHVPSWTEDKDFQDLIPRMLNLERDSELSLKIAKKIREFFFKDGIDLDVLIDVTSDLFFSHGVHQAIRQRIADPNIESPTYAYLLSHEGKASLKDIMSKTLGIPNEKKGVGHGDDVGYLFVTRILGSCVIEKGSSEYKTMRRMVDFWVNFATTGNPTNEKSGIDWRPTNISEGVYLEIGQDLELKNGLFKERMEFWDEIFRLAGYEL